MKKILKLYILFLIIIFMFCISSCKRNKKEYLIYGDFLYEIVNINDEGKDITPNSKNKNCVDTFARIMGLSESGKTKEIIIVPQFIEGYEVKQIGKDYWYTSLGKWESTNLCRVYIPFETDLSGHVFESENCPSLVRVLMLTNTYRDNLFFYIHITSYRHSIGDMSDRGTYDTFFSNVSYRFNYDNSPNDGYYWIDDYDYGSKITFIPDNPTREGYEFGGWYKEEECINEWDFENDCLPDYAYYTFDQREYVKYQETNLYAKWILN